MVRSLALITALSISAACGLKANVVTVASLVEHHATLIEVHPERIPSIHGDSHQHYFEPLAQFSPIPVVISEAFLGTEHLWGTNNGAVIWLNADQGPNSRVATLAHEIAHSFQPEDVGRFEADVFAEAVSVLFCERIGLKVWHSSLAYLGRHPELTSKALRKHRAAIEALVDRMVKAVQ